MCKGGGSIKTVFLRDGYRTEHRLAFAGEGALVDWRAGMPAEWQVRCQIDAEQPQAPSLGLCNNWLTSESWVPQFNETYRTFGASADGNVVFAYTGDESYCGLCNSRNGELKVHNARFAVWDRASGNVIARSPSLRVEVHSCPWLSLGACESYQQVPELQMSANGRSILAFWPQQGFPPPENVKGLGQLEVYTLR